MRDYDPLLETDSNVLGHKERGNKNYKLRTTLDNA